MSAHQEIIAAIQPGMDRKVGWLPVIDRRRVLRLCLRYWPGDHLPLERNPCNQASIDMLAGGLKTTVKQKYGNPFIILILAPLITYAINALLEWWFGSKSSHARMITAIEEERIQLEP